MKQIYAFIAILCTGLTAHAQVVTLTPTIVTQNDSVLITYDASQGNGALTGVSPVYMHTGVITNLSATPTSWRHVQGNWGTIDPNVVMTPIGNNKHTKKIHINSFYNVPANETVSALAFVFRNANGSTVGRNADGSDIFVPISTGGYTAFISSHSNRQYIFSTADTMKVVAVASANSDFEFFLNGSIVASAYNTTQTSYSIPMSYRPAGFYELVMKATNLSTTQPVYDTVYYLSRSVTPIATVPAYGEEGIKALNDSTMYFQLHAPYKSFVYLVGDFNNWLMKPEYEMKKTPNGQYFWGKVTGLDKNTEYGFQYVIDYEQLRVTDPYVEKILDPWNDPYITNSTYPNLKDYPAGKTTEMVGVFQIEEPSYTWSTTNYQRPAKEELVIYEMLIRDFVSDHTYADVIEKLDYLQWMGVNAIELMPIMEFEGNESWGYMPMFMMAPDKYYGPKNELKRFVDSCHARGIAVILDIALNHQFGQSPLVRMYFDPTAGQWGQPTPQNPWFNPVPKHEFNVGYDMNHESAATKYFTKKVIKHWVEEYKIDGYRFDLSKGFTQKNTLGSVSAWGQYDQGRINIWKDYSSHLWAVDSNLHIILEHFAENSEETVLSNEGMMLWGNMNYDYNEAAMGYASNLTGVSHQSRGWADMNLVGFAESHDEERIMYRTKLFGASNSGYNTRDEATALERMALNAAFFYTIPGPKMLWQFGELGYDYSINRCPDGTINNNCRVANKPIRWDYYTQPNRRALYNVVGELNYLRKNYPVFSYDKQHELSLSGLTKRIKLQDATMKVVVLGNFDIIPKSINPAFHQTGMWYEHFTRDSLSVNDVNATILLMPGEYRLYTTQKMPKSAISVDEPLPNVTPQTGVFVYPNPFVDEVIFHLSHFEEERLTIEVTDISGRVVWQTQTQGQQGSENVVVWQVQGDKLPTGVYLYRVQSETKQAFGKIIKQ